MEIEVRPKIKLRLSTLDKLLDVTSMVFLIAIWGLTAYTISKLPTTIPLHFNASGKANGDGNKLTLIIFPVLATLLFLGLTKLNKFPHVFNYMTRITLGNAEKQYTIATRMIRFLKLAILVIFFYVILFSYFTMIGVTSGLGVWFLPAMEAILLGPAIVGIIASLKNKSNVA